MEKAVANDAKNDAELHVKKLQLHWLLQITKAINYNMPSAQLFEIFETVMRDQLKVQKLVLYVHESEWQCMLSYGVEEDVLNGDVSLRLTELSLLQQNNVHMPGWVQGFDSIIPVFHDEKPLAYAFIADIRHEEITHLKRSVAVYSYHHQYHRGGD